MDQSDIKAIGEGLTRILQDADLLAMRQGADTGPLWEELEANGFTLFAVSQELGGLGANFADIVPLCVICGQFALPLPLADTMLGNAILSAAGKEPLTRRIALVSDRGKAPFQSETGDADHRLHCEDGQLIVRAGTDQTGHSARETVTETTLEIAAPSWMSPRVFDGLGAIVRVASMAGAMQAALDLTLEHTSTREQFGRALSKFQAIQRHLSDIASEAAAAAAATDLARDSLAEDLHFENGALRDIAAAKLRCGQAADIVASAAHQAHGAIGFTHEYSLGCFTRSLWQWRDEFGCATEWSKFLGEQLLSKDTPSLWGEVSL